MKIWKMEYIEITITDVPISIGRDNIFYKTLAKLAEKLIPNANPDFDQVICQVKIWLLEFNRDGKPSREIGLDKDRIEICKMPFENNYGYWCDNNFLLSDFKNKFSYRAITSNDFESSWRKI